MVSDERLFSAHALTCENARKVANGNTSGEQWRSAPPQPGEAGTPGRELTMTAPTQCPKCGDSLVREPINNASHPDFGRDLLVCLSHGSAAVVARLDDAAAAATADELDAVGVDSTGRVHGTITRADLASAIAHESVCGCGDVAAHLPTRSEV